MSKLFLIFIFIFLLSAQVLFANSDYAGLREKSPSKNSSPNLGQQDLVRKIEMAFADVRKGSYAKANKLISFGERIFPLLEPYLEDENKNVRHDVVRIAFSIGGDKALAVIAQALNNSEPEVRLKTADKLYLLSIFAKKYQELGNLSQYKDYTPEKIAAHSLIGKSLQKDAKTGNVSIQSVFLLANFPSQETEKTLKILTSTLDEPTKEDSIQLAAKIVLSRLGNAAAVKDLTDSAAQENLRTLKFLLKNLGEIDSKEVIYALTKTLDNKTIIVKGNSDGKTHQKTKSGVWIDYPIARRLCDLAVNSFVERLDLKVNFTLHNGTYTEPQLDQVRSKLKNIDSITITVPTSLIK